MKQILILGAGTAGTMMAVQLKRKLDLDQWAITVVDQDPNHYYQPGYLFIPFGIYDKSDVIRPGRKFIPKGVNYLLAKAETIDYAGNQVKLEDGNSLAYDILIIATGSRIAPEENEGLLESGWQENIFDFYTADSADKLGRRLQRFEGGKLVVHIAENPIKCPVAPLEFVFMADAWLQQRGIRHKTELSFVTPLPAAFSKPDAARVMGGLMGERGIELVPDFSIEHAEANKIVSYDEKAVEFDLLVTTPTNMGDPVMERSGIGDDLNFVPTDNFSLQAEVKDNIFVIGDATDLPSSKAGSVIHFQSEILAENILSYIAGRELSARFDGHSNCFIESGHGKAFLIDFNYELDPVEGTYPFPVVGPFSLLKETRLNHLGKLGMKFIYWNILLRGIPVPGITSEMGRAGKKIPK